MLQKTRLTGVMMTAAIVLTALLPLTAKAQYTLSFSNYNLGGTLSSDAWTNLTATAIPGTGSFPGTTMWSPVASQSGGGTAQLAKVANGSGGGPYMAGGSIYFGGFSADINNFGGTLMVQDATPVSGLQTLVFQISIGEAWTYDFYNHELPVLNLTLDGGVTLSLEATYWAVTDKFDNGSVEMPTGTEEVYINTYALQWDLSNLDLATLLPTYTGDGSITSFNISFSGVQHAQIYGMQLDQSDAANPNLVQSIPEPSTYVLLGIGVVVLFLTARHRSSKFTIANS
ncbi:MAG: PEP-CTERM sorting domain-containing protein [Verrucomicrobiales bacterium]|jgi:hypothetical protein|nr:PEP-CTERM sorting domain-containing protein [Verrucomicrobiales bacterium]